MHVIGRDGDIKGSREICNGNDEKAMIIRGNDAFNIFMMVNRL